jgi:hypothetical protein
MIIKIIRKQYQRAPDNLLHSHKHQKLVGVHQTTLGCLLEAALFWLLHALL